MRLAPPPILIARLLPSPRSLRWEIDSLASLESGETVFLCRQLRFQVVFFLLRVSFRRPHCLAAKPARPLTVPSKDYSRGGGLAARLFSEGRRTEDAMQSRKKKNMKTKQQNKSGAREQIRNTEQHSNNTTAQTDKPDNRLPIDAEARKKNRMLPITKVLDLLKSSNPGLYNLAEVVGRWIWIAFRETPAPELRQKLAQLGFHWNRERQAWQHPCGQFRLHGQSDPHDKYSCYFPADVRPA